MEHCCPAASGLRSSHRYLREEQKARPEHIPGGEPVPSNPVGTVLHPESGSHSFHPRTGNAEAALSETDIPGNLFSPCQNLPVGGRLPEPHLFSSLPGGSGSPVNGCHCQKIIIVIGSLASHQRLPPGSTHIKFPIVLQDILHGVRLVIIPGQSCREAHMGSFDGIISMVNSYNDKSPHPFRFFLFFSSRWSFGLEKEKKGRTPKSPAHDICISLRCYLLFVIKSEYYCF